MTSSVLTGDIRQTLDHFRRSVDQLFENFYGFPAESARAGAMTTGSQHWTFSPAVETAWGDTALNMRVILPAIAQQDVKVSVQNNQLVIEGERKPPEGFKQNAYTQLAYGKFYAAVTLPNGLDLDKLTCRLHDGVLDIQIPISEQMKPRQIQIQSGEGRKSISA
jgi:HSP20 family protein